MDGVFVIFVIVGGIILWRIVRAADVRQITAQKTAALVKEHLPRLITRREQLVRKDAYGGPLFENWLREISYFIEKHIKPRLTPQEQSAFVSVQSRIAEAIFGLVEAERVKNPAFLSFSTDMTPSEFETFCAEELRRAGWDARVTKQSRDQGADVVAQKEDIRVVVQCKLYVRPVGNKAVQEIAAAKAHEQAHYGVVVSNKGYTQDAEQLASTNKIRLLHYTELCKLDDIIGLTSPVSATFAETPPEAQPSLETQIGNCISSAFKKAQHLTHGLSPGKLAARRTTPSIAGPVAAAVGKALLGKALGRKASKSVGRTMIRATVRGVLRRW